MNFKNKDPKFIVYVHTSPQGKRYIGITSRTAKDRWGVSGKGYRDNKHFYAAIQLYGWENFDHKIVAKNLDLNEASKLESNLIAKYDTMNPDKGYNQTTGGNWSRPSDEVRLKLSKVQKKRSANPEYRARMSEIQKRIPHSPMSEETKQKISNTLKGRTSPAKGNKWSESQRAAIRGRTPWNKGKTKETDKSVKKISDALQNREFSPETISAMSNSRKKLYMLGYSPIWINNGQVEKQIDSSKNDSIPDGFVKGRLATVYITDGVNTKKITPDELNTYLELGWTEGKSEKINEVIRQARKQYIWTYDGIDFDNAVDLANYLRGQGYPKIVGSTITNLYNKGFENSKTYQCLSNKITRRKVNHEDS